MTAPFDALAVGLGQIHVESAGLLDLIIVQPVDVPHILADALRGRRESMRLLVALNDAADRITSAPRRLPMLCSSCPRPLRKGRYSFGVALPSCDSPTQGLALAVCTRCATRREDVHTKAVQALREIWPELRAIEVTHASGGRA